MKNWKKFLPTTDIVASMILFAIISISTWGNPLPPFIQLDFLGDAAFPIVLFLAMTGVMLVIRGAINFVLWYDKWMS